MVDLGSYLLGAVQLALVVVPVGFSAYWLRQRLLPSWVGAPARLVEAIVGIALVIWLSEILGMFGLFYAGALIAAVLLVAGTLVLWPAGPVADLVPPPLSGWSPKSAPPAGGASAGDDSAPTAGMASASSSSVGGGSSAGGGSSWGDASAVGGVVGGTPSCCAGGGGSPAATGPAARPLPVS